MIPLSTIKRMHGSVRSVLKFREVFEAYLLGCQMPEKDINQFFHTFSPEELEKFNHHIEGQDALLHERIQDVFERALIWLTFRKNHTTVSANVRNTLEKFKKAARFPFTSIQGEQKC